MTLFEFPPMTDAQSVRCILTLPWAMGNNEAGEVSYDASEIETVLGYVNKLNARAEAAEAEVGECRAERARYGDMMTEKLSAAEAENDRLRAQVVALEADKASIEALALSENLSEKE